MSKARLGHRRILTGLPPRRQRGVALVLVLWILLLVTVSTGAYTMTARMDTLEAHTILSGTQARLAAEAGINLAVLSLRDPDEERRLVPDGRVYSMDYEGILVEVRVTDERGKLDVNAASEETFIKLLTENGVEEFGNGLALIRKLGEERGVHVRSITEPAGYTLAQGSVRTLNVSSLKSALHQLDAEERNRLTVAIPADVHVDGRLFEEDSILNEVNYILVNRFLRGVALTKSFLKHLTEFARTLANQA